MQAGRDVSPEQLIAQALALDAQAREHKRAAQRHREAAQEARRREAEIIRKCRRLGIRVVYEKPHPDQPTCGEGDIHGRSQPGQGARP